MSSMKQEIEEEIRIFKESHSRLLAVLRERQKRRRLQLEANGDLRKHVDTRKKQGSPDRDNKLKKTVVSSYKPYGIPSSVLRKSEQVGHRKHSTDHTNKGDSTQDGEKTIRNDYCQYFVDSGRRPQNFIRDTELSQRFDEYPKLKDLTKLKNALVSSRATPPTYLKADLRSFELKSIGTKFDVILIDPPLKDLLIDGYFYKHNRLLNSSSSIHYANLKIEDVAATPSFIFIWSGDADGLDRGRQLLLKWGYRRCEDIVWIKTNKAWEGSRFFEERSVFQRTKEHCIMGIKGTVRRSTDGHFIHCNVDTDVIISEEPPFGSTRKPEELYHIIEHFCLGRRRLELFGEDHNIRPGWLTIGNGLSSSNFDANTYASYFSEQNGYLLGSTPDIESLRPKSPPIQPKPGPAMKQKPKKPINNNTMAVPPIPQMTTFPARWISSMDGNIYGKGQ
ncbi:2050_t:CDS:2 [Acaulospora colombiana]|uniref:2050_t:CDS:1 n=1 Tax=Acaulospora colombiana TaxID=27376 RepID=A0ACA9LT07_9GLOM|nr:2050_t:CDS:2 [Acaulospora colombiana]